MTQRPIPTRRYGPRFLLVSAILLVGLAGLSHRTGLDKAAVQTAKAPFSQWSGDDNSVTKGFLRFFESALPPKFSRTRELQQIPDFNRLDLPLFAEVRTITQTTQRFDHETNALVAVLTEVEVLYEPCGYLLLVLVKMLESTEIAILGTLLALLVGLPLSILGCAALNFPPLVRHLARALSSASRAIPELIFALVFVLAYSFGPVAGILALAAHCVGFFGKFLADDMENADRGPSEALFAAGAGRLAVFRWALWPAIFPQFIAYLQYIFERNVRSATVLGIVGAGGIGMEMKGRFDSFEFDHVMTILLVIIASVWLLERLAQSLRAKLL